MVSLEILLQPSITLRDADASKDSANTFEEKLIVKVHVTAAKT